MCWWQSYKNRINGPDACRNLVVLVFKQFEATTGNKLQSITSKKNIKMPNTINHDERCNFAAIIASIIGEAPEKGFEICIEAALKLKKYNPDDQAMREGQMLTKFLIDALTQSEKEGDLEDSVKLHLSVFAAAVINSFKIYNQSGKSGSPDGPYVLKYLYDLLP